jgi:magnesium chelatase subunit I
MEVSDQLPAQEYLDGIKEIAGLKEAIKSLEVSDSPSLMASATEFVLEGLHLHQKLNKEIEGGRATYGK